jgi:hypothetical protein
MNRLSVKWKLNFLIYGLIGRNFKALKYT